MAGLSNYDPPKKENWQGRTDVPPSSCIYQAIELFDLNHPPSSHRAHLAFALLGFRCDAGIKRNQGREGAQDGPKHVRQVLRNMPIPRDDINYYDAGDIFCLDEDLETAQLQLSHAIHVLLAHQLIPIVVGGGHELAYGHYEGLASTQAPQSIINFDAHLDMRPLLAESKGSSGTPFLQIANHCQTNNRLFEYHCIGVQKASNIPLLFSTAKEHHVQIVYADTLQADMTSVHHYIDKLIAQTASIYTSICLDVFATPYAPGVSAPQPLGVMPWQIIPLLRKLAASKKVISYDIAELSPPYDIDDRTAKLAANLIFEIMTYHAQ